MARKNLIRTSQFPYHVTTRSNNQEWFDLPISRVWQICLDALKQAHEKHPVELISFVLMSNHYHMMLRTPEKNLDLFMYELNKNISLGIRIESKRINRVFGTRYKWCLIRSNRYLSNCYRYIYQNPLRANIVKKCEQYPYSTLYYMMKNYPFPLAIHDIYGFKDRYVLNWLNEGISELELSGIRNSLKKTELINVIDRRTRKPLVFNSLS